jgi:hypothetical protein
MSDNYLGLYRGIVTNNSDPEGYSRIQALVPQVFGNNTTYTAWAWPVPAVSEGFSVPNPGQQVWIGFEGGDTDHPYWVASIAALNKITSSTLSVTNPTGPVTDIEGVGSFNGRQGAVSLTAADVESTFTAAGQLFVGTGSGAGELLAGGATGQYLAGSSGNPPYWAGLPPSAYTLIGSNNSGAAFTSISTAYNHLRFVGIARSSLGGGGPDFFGVQFNSDTGANYDSTYFFISGAALAVADSFAGTSIYGGEFAYGTQTAGVVSQIIIDIPWYAGTSDYKTTYSQTGFVDGAKSSRVYTVSWGTWRNTAAINAVKVLGTASGSSFTVAQFWLYGII